MTNNEIKIEEQIASTITNLADAVEALLKGPLNRKALLVLLAHSTKLPQKQVSDVLIAIQDLRKDYLK